MRYLVLSLMFLLAYFPAMTQEEDPREVFSTANQLYSKGEYQQALGLYHQILEQGMESPELFYNLGNVYYKTGDLPSSILFLEKSLKYDPSNPDAKFNLKLANLKIADKIEPLPELPVKVWYRELVFSNNSDTWGWMSVVAMFVAALFFAGFMASRKYTFKKIFFYSGVLAVVFCAFSSILGYQQKSYITNSSYAIVFAPTLTVKSAPDNNGTKLFVIHEGTKVKELESLSEWVKISLANGNVGWVKAGDLKRI